MTGQDHAGLGTFSVHGSPATSDRAGFAFKGVTLDGDWTVELKAGSAGGSEQMGREACDAVLTELEPCFGTWHLSCVTWETSGPAVCAGPSCVRCELSSIPSLHPLDASAIPTSCNNQHCLPTSPSIPCGLPSPQLNNPVLGDGQRWVPGLPGSWSQGPSDLCRDGIRAPPLGRGEAGRRPCAPSYLSGAWPPPDPECSLNTSSSSPGSKCVTLSSSRVTI